MCGGSRDVSYLLGRDNAGGSSGEHGEVVWYSGVDVRWTRCYGLNII